MDLLRDQEGAAANMKKEKRVNIQELRKICWDVEKQTDEFKKNMGNWEQVHLSRKISIWITYFLIDRSISPNQVTILWIVLGVFGSLLFIINAYWVSMVAIFLLYASWILDNVDGELARYRKQFSIEANFLDMLGHQVILPLVFGCLTFSMILKNTDVGIIFLGIVASVLVTPLNKMQENALLLLSIKAISDHDIPESMKTSVDSDRAEEMEGKSLKRRVIAFTGMIFSQVGMVYLLIIAVIVDFTKGYLLFYGIGIPLVLIPKCLIRLRTLKRDAEDPDWLKKRVRPEWRDS